MTSGVPTQASWFSNAKHAESLVEPVVRPAHPGVRRTRSLDVHDEIFITKRMVQSITHHNSPASDSRPLHPPVLSWRDALTRLQRDTSRTGWRRLQIEAMQLGCPPALWGSLYSRTIVQRGIFQCALLAVLEEPAHLHERALACIRDVATVATTPPARSPARPTGDFEFRLALTDAMSSPPMAIDLCIGIAGAYARSGFTSQPGAVDAALASARDAARAGDKSTLLSRVAHAGALALRGDAMWDGWLREGPADFQASCAVLVTCLDWLNLMQIDLTGVHAALLAAISDRHGESRRTAARSSGHPPLPPLSLELLLAEVMTIVRNGGLAADHPARRDSAQYQQLAAGILALCHTRAEFDAFGSSREPHLHYEKGFSNTSCLSGPLTTADAQEAAFINDENDDEDIHAAMAQLEADCIVALGHLRFDTPDALNTLLHRAVDSDLYPAVGQAAVWALQQIGAASLAGARATMRYASDPYARRQAQLIFGGAARNNPAAFDELAAQFQSTRWDEGRADFALPLALTDDLRCPALLVESLRQAPPSAADVSGILEALDQLDIAWQWIAEIQGIELPDFSRISNLPGLSFPPLERTLRA